MNRITVTQFRNRLIISPDFDANTIVNSLKFYSSFFPNLQTVNNIQNNLEF